MLTTLRQDILHDRSSQIDGDSDKLWSDTTLIRYIDEAQTVFARRALVIRDGTSAVTRFQTVPYQEDYPLDASILAISSMKFLGNAMWINGVLTPGTRVLDVFTPNLLLPVIYGDKADLGRTGHSGLNNYPIPDRYFFNPQGLSELPPGKPMAFDTDEFVVSDTTGSSGAINVHLYPQVSPQYAGCTVQMRVSRLPINPLTNNNLDAYPEVPSIYHLYLLDHAAYLALRIVDHELGDPQRAMEFEQMFLKHIEDARSEMLRKTFTPMQWAFGRNGFSYPGN